MDATLDRTFFESRLHERFQVGEGPAEVELVECNRLKSHAEEKREPFSLVFRGPAEPFLPQRTYVLRNERTEPVEVFLVPVGRDAAGFLYEAVFN